MLIPVEKISCFNDAAFVMNFSIQWLDSDGNWQTTSWNSGNYPIGETRTSPSLSSIGVPEDALAVTPYVHAILGDHERGSPLVKATSNGGVAAYEVKGTTLDFSVTPATDGCSWESRYQHNWSKTINLCVDPAANVQSPTTFDQLTQALGKALSADGTPNGTKVRVLSSGHSWSLGIVPGNTGYPLPTQDQPAPFVTAKDGQLIDISGMNPEGDDPYLSPKIFQDSTGTAYVAVPPGTQQGWIAQYAAGKGYALGSMGPAPQITLGGFVANGCHGTGWDQPTVSDFVVGIEVVTFQPTHHEDGGAYEVVPMAYALNQEIADKIQANDVVRASTITVSPEALDALRVSLGALGVITKLVFQLEPLPLVQYLDEIAPVTTGNCKGVFDSTANLRQLVTSCDYTEIFWFPFNDASQKTTYMSHFGPNDGKSAQVTVYGNQLWVKRYTVAPSNSSPQFEKKVTDVIDKTSNLAGMYGGTLAWILKHIGVLTPMINQFSFQQLKAFMGNRQMRSLDFASDWQAADDPIVPINVGYIYQKQYFTSIIDLSWALPIPDVEGVPDFTNVVTAWNELQGVIDHYAGNSSYPVNLTVHLRFVKNSPSLLSPANQADASTHTCFIEYLSFTNDLELYKKVTETVVTKWYDIGGLPHFAKAFQLGGSDINAKLQTRLAARDRLADFNRYRTQLDPGKFFENRFLSDLLGAPGATVEAD